MHKKAKKRSVVCMPETDITVIGITAMVLLTLEVFIALGWI